MTTVAIILIIVSAFIHVVWNLLAKSHAPSSAYFLLTMAGTVVLAVPVIIILFPLVLEIPNSVWGFILLTGFCQAIYFTGLGGAYRHCEMSVAYPMARALPVVVVPLVTAFFGLGEPITPRAYLGIVLTIIGCFSLPFVGGYKRVFKEVLSPGYLFVLLAALGTTGYSIIDSHALGIMRQSLEVTPLRSAVVYFCVTQFAILPFLITFVLMIKKEREAIVSIWRENKWHPVLVGLTVAVAYMLVLVAMGLARNVSYIVAFRQVGIPIGVLLGVFVLKEQPSRIKFVGAIFIFVGLVLLAL